MIDENLGLEDSREDGLSTISTEQFLVRNIPEFMPFLHAVGEVPIQIPTAKGKVKREVTLGEWLEEIKLSNQDGPIKLSPDDISSIAGQMRQAFPEDYNYIFPGALDVFPYFGIDDLWLRDPELKRRLTLLQKPLRGFYGLVADYIDQDPRVLDEMGYDFDPLIYKDRRSIRNNNAKFVSYFLTLNSDYSVPPAIIVEMYKILMDQTGLNTLSLLMDGAIMQKKGVQSIRSPKPGQLEGLLRGITAEIHGVSALMKLGV